MMKKKRQILYVSPKVKIVEIEAQKVLCQSVPGGFGLSNSSIGKGNGSDWGGTLGW